MQATIEHRLSWEEFLEELVPRAKQALEDRTQAGVENYLALVAAAACRLNPESIAAPKTFQPHAGYPNDAGFHLFHQGSPFIAVQWHLEPDASMPYHPHAGASVCTVLLEGSARVRNFQFLGAPQHEPPDWEKKGDIVVQHTREDLLLPGRINLIGNPHDNIHGFQAGPRGARGIDITTIHHADQRRPDTILEIAPAPRDPERGTYQAFWREM